MRPSLDSRLGPAGTLLVALAVLLAAAPPGGTGQQTTAVLIPETDLVVDRPAHWRRGGLHGLGVLLSYIGAADGYPRFTVQHDPEASLPETATLADAEAAIEELFEQIVELLDATQVLEAEWTEVNGIRAHRSTITWDSVAGEIRGRRLILLHGDRPVIFAWIDRNRHFPEIADLVAACMDSLRRASTSPVAAR